MPKQVTWHVTVSQSKSQRKWYFCPLCSFCLGVWSPSACWLFIDRAISCSPEVGKTSPLACLPPFCQNFSAEGAFWKPRPFPGLTDLGLVTQGDERSVHKVKPMWLNTLSLLCTCHVPTLLVPRSPHPSKEMKMRAQQDWCEHLLEPQFENACRAPGSE